MKYNISKELKILKMIDGLDRGELVDVLYYEMKRVGECNVKNHSNIEGTIQDVSLYTITIAVTGDLVTIPLKRVVHVIKIEEEKNNE